MTDDGDRNPHRVVSHLGELLEARGLTLVQLAALTGVTVANLSVLKNGRARAIRFSTLTALCDALDCRPGDLLDVERDDSRASAPQTAGTIAKPWLNESPVR